MILRGQCAALGLETLVPRELQSRLVTAIRPNTAAVLCSTVLFESVVIAEYLDEVFPDARFVMTHRDPTDVLLSVADVYADIVGGFTDHLDRRYLGELNVAQWSTGMQRVCRLRAGPVGARFFDIDFTAMAVDPIGQVRRLYTWLGRPVRDEFEAGMAHWWAQNSANREPHPKADPADFGLDFDAVRPLFADYLALAADWTER